MKCLHCGAPLVANAKFCGNCGQPANNVNDTTDDLATSPTSTANLNQTADPGAGTIADQPIEPPASVPGSGPIIEAKQRRIWPFIIVAAGLVLVAGAGYYGWVRLQLAHFQKSDVSTPCYSFKLPSKLISANDGTVCGTYSEDFNTSVEVQLLPAEVNETSIQAYAQKDDANAKKISFAGQPAYKTTPIAKPNSRKTVTIYAYDRGTKVHIAGRSYHGYSITFGDRKDVDKLMGDVAASWQWSTQDATIDPLSGYVAVTTAGNTCYSFELPADAKAYQLDECITKIQYGSNQTSTLKVDSLIGDYPSLAQYTNEWNKVEAKNVDISSESDIKLDGIDAHKVIYRYKSYGTDQVIIFAYTAGRYKSKGLSYGLQIDGDYDAARGNRAKVDAMLDSWHWN